MRHGGRTDFAHEERFFQFKNFCSLQCQDFMHDAAKSSGAKGKNGNKFSLVIAGNMPSNRRGLQTKDLEHAFLGF